MKIVLREVRIEDGVNIARWRNSINVVRHCIDKTVISEESNKKFFEKMIIPGKYKQYIVEKYDDEFGGIFTYQIGTIYFKDIDLENKKCELGLFPSDDEEWNSEGQELALKKMVEIAFNEMHIHKVYAYVYSDCEEENKLFEKCGFKIEGKFISEIYEAGIFRDVLRYGIIKEA